MQQSVFLQNLCFALLQPKKPAHSPMCDKLPTVISELKSVNLVDLSPSTNFSRKRKVASHL